MDKKITIIAGTNREGSRSEKVALQYQQLVEDQNWSSNFISLEKLPRDFAFSELYGNRTTEFQSEIDRKISGCEKFVFVIPEYNGSFPGVLKTFIDAIPPSEWNGKKAGLIGISSGRAGAARAMDQFTNILNYLKVSVLYSKPKLSGIEGLMDENQIIDENTVDALRNHLKDLIAF